MQKHTSDIKGSQKKIINEQEWTSQGRKRKAAETNLRIQGKGIEYASQNAESERRTTIPKNTHAILIDSGEYSNSHFISIRPIRHQPTQTLSTKQMIQTWK